MSISATDKLARYNGALRRLKARSLASLTEARESRRVLDGAWGGDDALVRYALERGEWNFALKAAELTYSQSVTPTFGFQYAFDKPTDYVRLAALSAGDRMQPPLVASQYTEEAVYWFADHQNLYVRYVSDDPDYGFNSSAWSESFSTYIECLLAFRCADRITNSRVDKADIAAEMEAALKGAKSVDAMSEGVKFRPSGSWVGARLSGWRDSSRR